MLFRLSSGDVQIPRLIGAFIVFAALIMFVGAAAHMFDSWDALKKFPSCVTEVNEEYYDGTLSEEVAQLRLLDCKDSLYNITGLALKGNQYQITNRQFWVALLGPIANLFVWAVVFLLGLIFYRTGNIVIPIEQTIRDIPEVKHSKKKKK